MGNFDQLVAQVGNAMGTIWNAWQTTWSGVTDVSRQAAGSNTFWRGNTLIRETFTRTTTTTTHQQNRTGVNTQVLVDMDYESIGDKLRSTSVIPFMRVPRILTLQQKV